MLSLSYFDKQDSGVQYMEGVESEFFPLEFVYMKGGGVMEESSSFLLWCFLVPHFVVTRLYLLFTAPFLF